METLHCFAAAPQNTPCLAIESKRQQADVICVKRCGSIAASLECVSSRPTYSQQLDCGMSRTLILIGIVLVAAGVLWPLLDKLGLGRLPGDIVVERDNFTLYIPVTTAILISAVLSLVLWLLNR
jgi:hypothetical protein